MSKFKITETFTNGVAQNTFISATDEATALGICVSLYGGQHQAFEASTNVTVEDSAITPVSFKRVRAMLKNESTDNTTFLSFIVKDTVSDLDVVNTLKNKTINAVKADTVTILSISKTTV